MRSAVLTVLLVLGLAACGGDDGTAPGNGTDKAFAEQMVPHHRSAIEMAQIAQRRGESAFVKTLAGQIIAAQEAEITTLRRELEGLEDVEASDLGTSHSAMGMEGDAAGLRTAEPFDEAFLDMMIPHHEGAIEMAEAELAKGTDPELRALAEQIIDAQRSEIAQMRTQLERTP